MVDQRGGWGSSIVTTRLVDTSIDSFCIACVFENTLVATFGTFVSQSQTESSVTQYDEGWWIKGADGEVLLLLPGLSTLRSIAFALPAYLRTHSSLHSAHSFHNLKLKVRLHSTMRDGGSKGRMGKFYCYYPACRHFDR